MHRLSLITLDLSFILYLFFYIPQLWRNIRYQQIQHLSFGFHALLFIAATADLFYGFGQIQQWQYKTISATMFICLLIQHLQIARHLATPWYQNKAFLSLTVVIIGMLLFLSDTLFIHKASSSLFIFFGWIERSGYWLYAIPQIIKNRRSHHATVISPSFLIIGLITGLLDFISALGLHWASPSLYGTPVAIMLHAYLLQQYYKDR